MTPEQALQRLCGLADAEAGTDEEVRADVREAGKILEKALRKRTRMTARQFAFVYDRVENDVYLSRPDEVPDGLYYVFNPKDLETDDEIVTLIKAQTVDGNPALIISLEDAQEEE